MQRWKQAINHYKSGCDAGDPTACRAIGLAYLEGKGLPKSPSAAAVWLERACLPDDPVACRLLGQMVSQGVGVPKADPERGKQLLVRACDAKDAEACSLLQGSGAGSGSGSDAAGAGSADGSGSASGSASAPH